jgi:uncharacterized protein with PIN domain
MKKHPNAQTHDGSIARTYQKYSRKEVSYAMHRCALCNEHIEEVDIQFNEVAILDDEYWHLDCYAEYFGEVFEEA